MNHQRDKTHVKRSLKRPHHQAQKTRPKRHRRWRRLGMVLLVIGVILGVGRAIMPWAVQRYVNRTLDQNPLYAGSIGAVHIHLWRGAYSIDDVRFSKVTGNVPVPLFSAQRVDLAIQWDALIHGSMVGRILADKPQINFVAAPSESGTQTGAGGPWLEMVQKLFPFRINRAIVQNGSIHFRTYQAQTPVDVYLSEVQVTVDDLTNIRDETKPLVATVQVHALAMGQAKFQLLMTLNPFSYRPTFHMAMRLLGLDVTKLNNLTRAYGKFDFERGWFDLVVEADAKEGLLTGYAKPLFRDLQVFSLSKDLQGGNVINAFWQALLGVVTTVLKNPPRDQFGTLIPFTGDLSGSTTADLLATIGNILRNAFVRAYLPRLQGGQTVGGMTFGPAQITGPLSVGEAPQ